MALARQVSRRMLRQQWRLACLVFAQLVLIFLIVFQALQVAGLHVNLQLGQVFFRPSFGLQDTAVLAAAVIALVALYFAVKRLEPALFRAEGKAPGMIKREAGQKLSMIRKEPQAPALLLIEAAFVVALVLAVRAYLDPEVELIPWSSVGIGPPVTTIVNTVIALAVFGVFYYLYSLTAWYRKK